MAFPILHYIFLFILIYWDFQYDDSFVFSQEAKCLLCVLLLLHVVLPLRAAIATSCEDTLIRSSTDQLTDDGAQKLGAEVVPSVLSAAATDEQWVRRGAVPSLAGCASVSKSRTVLYQRGKAWVGLERAREAAGWLPADTMVTAGSQAEIEDEDPERLVLFDDIKYCLLDLNTFDPRPYGLGVNRTNRIIGLQQRLLLHCLVFLGAFDPDSAAAYQLPAGKDNYRCSAVTYLFFLIVCDSKLIVVRKYFVTVFRMF